MTFTKAFVIATAERAIKTFAQSLLAVVGVTGIGIGDVDWVTAFSVAGVATLASVLSSIISAGFGGDGPSLTNAETIDAPKHSL